MSKKQYEYILQKAVCKFLNRNYPDVLFVSTGIPVKLTAPQAQRNKDIQKEDFKCPDLLILEPNKQYYGLYLELKHESPFKKNGDLYKDEHLQGQQKSMDQLSKKGYLCSFEWDFERIKAFINWYMSNR